MQFPITKEIDYTDQQVKRFTSYVEGVLPDLLGGQADEGIVLPDDKDAIYDFVADRSCDAFPNVGTEKRKALARRLVKHFCG